jgi:tetratricopeptide (TPR) repeat protein
MQAQEKIEVTRDHLSLLYSNAQKAERSGNFDEAISIYRSILYMDDKQAIPYLKIGNMYAAKPDNAENVSTAIAFYEKYLELVPNGKESANTRTKIAALKKKEHTDNVDISSKIHIDAQQAMQNINAVVKNQPDSTKPKREIIERATDSLQIKIDKVIDNLENKTPFVAKSADNNYNKSREVVLEKVKELQANGDNETAVSLLDIIARLDEQKQKAEAEGERGLILTIIGIILSALGVIVSLLPIFKKVPIRFLNRDNEIK